MQFSLKNLAVMLVLVNFFMLASMALAIASSDLDDNIVFTVLDESSPEWAIAKGGAQDISSSPLEATRIVATPTTLQTSTRASATSTPNDLNTPSRIFRTEDIVCFEKVAIIAKSHVKEAFIKHTCNLWDDIQLRSGTPHAAMKMEMLREGVKMYLYIGIMVFSSDWVYALNEQYCTSMLMRIIDKCTEINLLKGGAWRDDHIEYLINVLEVDSVPPTLT